jgi:hypothetical protein
MRNAVMTVVVIIMVSSAPMLGTIVALAQMGSVGFGGQSKFIQHAFQIKDCSSISQ